MYRSGTSRGPYILASDLPTCSSARDDTVASLLGTNHPQRITGLGGESAVTCKCCIVRPSQNGDVSYLFRQVDEHGVDNSHGDCGNMIAGVACFALERGLVTVDNSMDNETSSNTTTVTVLSECTGAVFDITVQTPDGRVTYDGNAFNDGVPGTASPVEVNSRYPTGTTTGTLLPTGNVIDLLRLPRGNGKAKMISATCIDACRPMVFIDASELSPGACMKDIISLSTNSTLHQDLECLRLEAGRKMGLGDCEGRVSPKVCLVDAPPLSSPTSLSCRYWVAPFRQEIHPSLAMTAAQCTAIAGLLKGSVVEKLIGKEHIVSESTHNGIIKKIVPLGHPKGIVRVSVELAQNDAEGGWVKQSGENVLATGYTVTVEPICEGNAYLKQ